MNQHYCTTGGCDCPTPRQQSCQSGCQTEPAARCGCADDFRTLLGIICGPQLRGLVDFTAFGFITDQFLMGTTVEDPTVGTTPGDNLGTLSGSYVCGSAGCDAIAASGDLALAAVGATPVAVPVTQVALCRLDAIAFSVVGDADADANFQTLTQTLGQLLEPRKNTCCDSVAGSLLGAAAARSATVTAGPLAVFNSAVLGHDNDLNAGSVADGEVDFFQTVGSDGHTGQTDVSLAALDGLENSVRLP